MMKSSTRDLSERAYMIDDLGGMLASGDNTLAVVPSMFKRIMAEDAWLHFKTKFGNEVTYEETSADFKRFVETPPLDGLGTTLTHLRQLIAGDTIAIGYYQKYVPIQQGARTDLDDNLLYTIQQVPPKPTGTSADARMRRLLKQRPDLYAQVMSRDLPSANAAYIAAGWSKRPITLSNPDDVDRIARTLRKNLTADQIEELVNRLTGDQP